MADSSPGLTHSLLVASWSQRICGIVLRRVVGGVPLEREDAVQFLVQDVAPSFAIILRAEVGLLDVGRLGVAEQRMFERAVSLDDAMPSRDRARRRPRCQRLLQLEHAVDRGLRESRRSLSGDRGPQTGGSVASRAAGGFDTHRLNLVHGGANDTCGCSVRVWPTRSYGGSELASLATFLDRGAGGLAAVVVEGEAGIGKSTVWQAATDVCAQRPLVDTGGVGRHRQVGQHGVGETIGDPGAGLAEQVLLPSRSDTVPPRVVRRCQRCQVGGQVAPSGGVHK